MTSDRKMGLAGFTVLMVLAAAASGCRSPGNHITLVHVPSQTVAGVATERGILVLKKPTIKVQDLYPIEHVYGNGVVEDEAKVVEANEYLALLKPYSTQLNNIRFLTTPMERDDELYVGILNKDREAVYLRAELIEGGALGDLVTCEELKLYPKPTADGYGGIGLFAYRDGSLWLAGILTPLRAPMDGYRSDVYPFVSLDIIWDFLPELNNNFNQRKRPFRPDLIYGVERDGTGE